MKKDLVFEIGTEEIPARFMNKTLHQLKTLAENKFQQSRIYYDEINTYGTPRRLVLYVKGLLEKQEDMETVIKGPSKKAACDSDNNPTKALLGFIKGNGLNEKDIYIDDLAGVAYIYAKKYEKGKNTLEILKHVLPQLITSIDFPKTMKWGNKSFRFVRPVRWLMPIYGDTLVEFNKDEIPCSKVTKGHRDLSFGDIEVNNAEEYFNKLENGFVIVDQNERKNIIKGQIENLLGDNNRIIDNCESLLEEVSFLVEYPTAFMGSFDKEFLTLPKEAVITPMKEHQRYFPIEDNDGNLINCFIAVRNGSEEYIDVVKEGNEKVLRARLSDAKFFFEEDKKIGLDQCVQKLKNVVFQETIGTMYDKTVNIGNAANYLSRALNISQEDIKHLERAAYLCKADLVTNMVKEFDELQGIMGREYAILQGESPIVANAIKEHYMPRFSEDDVPESLLGSILSISDKIDTITGCFAIGIKPTGSQDPYALRRQAIGIINIVLNKSININIRNLCNEVLAPYIKKGILIDSEDIIIKEIIEFIKGRLKNVLLEKGYGYDIIDAVLTQDLEDLYDAYLRITELSKWKKRDEFLEIISSFDRVSNLAKNCTVATIKSDLLIEEEEKILMSVFTDVELKFKKAVELKEYNNALVIIKQLKKPVDEFFDKVMVMVEDKEIRDNRLSILKAISDMMNIFADFSLIVINK